MRSTPHCVLCVCVCGCDTSHDSVMQNEKIISPSTVSNHYVGSRVTSLNAFLSVVWDRISYRLPQIFFYSFGRSMALRRRADGLSMKWTECCMAIRFWVKYKQLSDGACGGVCCFDIFVFWSVKCMVLCGALTMIKMMCVCVCVINKLWKWIISKLCTTHQKSIKHKNE